MQHDSIPFCERDTVREIDSAIELDVDDVEILSGDDHDPLQPTEPLHWCSYRRERCPLSTDGGLATVASLEGYRLVRLAQDVNVRLAEAVRAGLVSRAVTSDTVRLAGKSARITGDGYAPSPADAETSAVPGDLFASIMHVETILASLEEAMVGMPPVAKATAARAALAEYKRCFAGWSARVPADFRARIEQIVIACVRRAP